MQFADRCAKALDKINYKIKPYDIVLIMTGADKYFEKDNYFSAHSGMSAEGQNIF